LSQNRIAPASIKHFEGGSAHVPGRSWTIDASVGLEVVVVRWRSVSHV
jgi:hypothetical protein